jgi:hypothetical protein
MNKGQEKPVLLMVSDCGVHTGFASVAHNLINQLYKKYDIHVLAINYLGDPHPIQEKAKLYNPASKIVGDYYGINRINPLIKQLKPAVVFFINDPWVGGSYAEVVKDAKVPKVLYTPVDARKLKREYLEKLQRFDYIIPYTNFAQEQLSIYGLAVPMSVIGHGINTELFKPVDKYKARELNNFDPSWFIINLTDKNQIRKRLDLALYSFSEWVHRTNKPEKVKIHYHGPISIEGGWDILDLADSLDIQKRLIITNPGITTAVGVPDDIMPWLYGVADCGVSMAMGGGWELTVMERMAMKIPMIVAETAALAEWARGGVHYTGISKEPWFNINGLNTMSDVPSVEDTIAAFDRFYTDVQYRDKIAQAGFSLTQQPKYKWQNVAQQFDAVFQQLIKDFDYGK